MCAHLQGPFRQDQWDGVLAGVQLLKDHGKGWACTSVGVGGIAQKIREIMPDALFFERPVWTDRDPPPNHGGRWKTGEEWFNLIEPTAALAHGKTHTIFCNEWQTNDWSRDQMKRFVQFQVELIDACIPRGVQMTIGDWGVGTPGSPNEEDEAHQLEELQPLLDYAEAVNRKYGKYFVVINQHGYGVEGPGSIDMEAGAPDYMMRWTRTIENHPDLYVYGGEIGNAAKGVDGVSVGLFRRETLALMQQYTAMVLAHPLSKQYIGGAWWEICWPEKHTKPGSDWSKDDWTPIMDQYFQWVASS